MKLDVKKRLSELKEYVGRLDKKVKIIAVVVAVLVIAAAVAAALILNHKEYVPLFSELSQEEANEIVGVLQDDGVDYRYEGDGTILVEASQADSTRASLVYDGYPSSGFTYDIFTENAGGMATDSEQQTYRLYELQNRIGATIGLFDGVSDAKVTIALGETQRYVLESTTEETDQNTPSASVVVTMQNGAELSERQASAIQRLVARSVPNMQMENVSVFDQNGIELSAGSDGQSVTTTEAELSRIVEQKIEQKIVNVLVPFYGDGNIRVSANGSINMERIIRETTTYSTPEKINENDKTGIISNEQGSTTESTGTDTAAGVAGAEENADITEYNQQDGNANNTYNNETYNREYLVDQVREQTEIDPGVMDDLTVSISVNGDSFGDLSYNEVRELAANATGIPLDEAEQKITAVAAPFYAEEEAQDAVGAFETMLRENRTLLIAVIGGLILLLILIIVVRGILARRRRRREEQEELAEDEEHLAALAELGAEEDKRRKEMDILSMQNERSRELRENIREFAENNPEISAQMLRSWINGGEENGAN